MATNFKLNVVLNELRMSPNKLASLAEVRPDTVYKMYRNEMQRVHMDVIDKVMNALNEHSREYGLNKTYTISDIMEYSGSDATE